MKMCGVHCQIKPFPFIYINSRGVGRCQKVWGGAHKNVGLKVGVGGGAQTYDCPTNQKSVCVCGGGGGHMPPCPPPLPTPVNRYLHSGVLILLQKPVCTVKTLLKNPPESRKTEPSYYSIAYPQRKPAHPRVVVRAQKYAKRADGIRTYLYFK